MKISVSIAVFASMIAAQSSNLPSSFHLKLVTPVDSRTTKPGTPIRAAVISPESLLNSYLEGSIERPTAGSGSAIRLRFDRLVLSGKSVTVSTVVTDWVNSKGHKLVDDSERAMRLEDGEFRSKFRRIWLDEGAELRAKTLNVP